MTRVRLLALALSALAALLVGCVWLVPGLLDWNRYRDGIATFASAQIGRPVHIGGAITLNLLPQPILTAAGVSVDDDGDGIQLKARALRLRVGLGALLAGVIDARELTLQGAELRLPWPPPPGALGPRPPAWISGLRAQVEDGRLLLGALMLDHVEGTLATDPDSGTLSAAGVGEFGPDRWQFTARLAPPGRDGAAGLDISLDGQGMLRDTGGTFSGQLARDGALSGRVAGRGPDLSRLIAAPAVPWRGDGRLSASGGLAVADELALEIAGAPARGAVALRVAPAARLDLAIAAGRLDLDAWLPALLARPATTNPQAALPTGVDLSVEAAPWAGGTLRRVRAAIDLNNAGTLLRDVSATVPGGAQVQFSGQVTRPTPTGPTPTGPAPTVSAQAGLQFAGPVRVTAPDLPATLLWLQGLAPGLSAALPADVPKRADLSAQVVVTAGTLDLTALQGTLEDAAVTGTLSARAGARPALVATLAMDRLAAEAWMPGWTTGTEAGASPSLAGIEAGLGRLRAMDADLRVQVQAATWRGMPLGACTLELQTDASRVLLRRLEIRPAGTRITASGQMMEGLRLAESRLELASPDLAALRPLLNRAPWSGPAAALLRGPGTATLQASGPPDALATRLTLEMSDLRVETQPVLNLVTRRAAGALTVHHPGAPRLLEAFGVGGTAAWLGDGSFSIVGQVAVAPGRMELTGATLAAGAARATGRIALEGRKLTGQVVAETLPLPPVLPSSPEPLGLAWLRDWQAELRLEAAQVLIGLTPVLQTATADFSLDGGTLRLARLSGRAAGGVLAGGATLETTPDPPRLAVQVQATDWSVTAPLLDAPLDVVAGQVDAALDLTASGHSPAALLSTLDGTATLHLGSGLAQGFDLAAARAALALPSPKAALDAARTALSAGTTSIAASDVHIVSDRGSLTLNGTLSSEAGQASVAGTIDLRGATQDLRLALMPGSPGAPVLGLRVTGPVGAPVRRPELAGLARWLAERAPDGTPPPAPASAPGDQARPPSSTE